MLLPNPRVYLRDNEERTPLSGSSVNYFSLGLWDFEQKRSPLLLFLVHSPNSLVSPPLPPSSLSLLFWNYFLRMSHTGTFRGTPNKTIGRGRLPDFDGSNTSHIPRPRSDRPEPTSSHPPSSDVGSGTGTMSAASSRQRQTQSKRDEVRDHPIYIVPKTQSITQFFSVFFWA